MSFCMFSHALYPWPCSNFITVIPLKFCLFLDQFPTSDDFPLKWRHLADDQQVPTSHEYTLLSPLGSGLAFNEIQIRTRSFSHWNKDTLIAETLDQIPTYAHRMLSFGWLHCWGGIWCHRKPLTIVKITNGPLSTLAHCPSRDSVTPSRPL